MYANTSNAVPSVDISHPTSTSLTAVDAGCREHGFFLLTGHGLDELIVNTWDQTRCFFAADRSVRIGIERTLDNPLGYYDRELTKRNGTTRKCSILSIRRCRNWTPREMVAKTDATMRGSQDHGCRHRGCPNYSRADRATMVALPHRSTPSDEHPQENRSGYRSLSD